MHHPHLDREGQGHLRRGFERLEPTLHGGCAGASSSREKKKQLLWAELQKEVLAPVPHRHVVFTMPRLLRPLFRRRRELLLDLAQCAAEAIAEYTRREVAEQARSGIVASIATSGDLMQWHPHGHLLVTDGAFSDDGAFHTIASWNAEAVMIWLAACFRGAIPAFQRTWATLSITRILDHLGLSPPPQDKPPPTGELVRVPVDDESREIEAY